MLSTVQESNECTQMCRIVPRELFPEMYFCTRTNHNWNFDFGKPSRQNTRETTSSWYFQTTGFERTKPKGYIRFLNVKLKVGKRQRCQNNANDVPHNVLLKTSRAHLRYFRLPLLRKWRRRVVWTLIKDFCRTFPLQRSNSNVRNQIQSKWTMCRCLSKTRWSLVVTAQLSREYSIK